MRKILAFITVLILLAPVAMAQDDGDGQIWNTWGFGSTLNEDWKIGGELEFRDSSVLFRDRYYFHGDFGFTRSLNDSLSAGFAFRFVSEMRGGELELEQRPHGHLTYTTHFGSWTLEERNRVELRTFERSDTYIRYRNRVTLVTPWKLTRLGLQPFVADELFVNVNDGELNRNRIYAGVKVKPAPRLNLDVYYLWQSSLKSDYWKDYHAFGIKAKVGL